MGTLETPEKSKELVQAAVSGLVHAAGGDSTVALNALLEAIQEQAIATVAEKSTVATRKEAFKRMVAENDIDGLEELETIAAGIMGRILSNSLETETGLLTPDQSKALMEEHQDAKRIIEALQARTEQRKAAVFRHITEAKVMDGVKDPENVNGDLEVPELGLRFARQGTGYGKPTIDQAQLRALVGEDVWSKSCEVVSVPSVRFSMEKFLNQARSDVTLLEHLRAAGKPGAPKSPSMAIHRISSKET